MISFFIIAVLIGYIYDYRSNKAKYGEKGQAWLYLITIGTIVLLILKQIFF